MVKNTFEIINDSLNKTITDINIIDNNLYINFDDETALRVWDEGDSYNNERRYMSCPLNNLRQFIGTQFTYFNYEFNFDITKTYQVLYIKFHTTFSLLCIENINEKNDGFSLRAEITKAWSPRF